MEATHESRYEWQVQKYLILRHSPIGAPQASSNEFSPAEAGIVQEDGLQGPGVLKREILGPSCGVIADHY